MADRFKCHVRPRMRCDADGMWRCWSPGNVTWEKAEIAQRACSATVAYLNWLVYYQDAKRERVVHFTISP